MSEPAPFMAVEEPQQLKAFTDPLRTRLLVILGEKAATNQQLADEIGEAQAKVLYHLRILLDAGLIRLVDTQIKGGNVEKYYRAVARTFDLRLTPELRPEFYQSQLAVLGQEIAASARTWAEQPPFYTARGRNSSLASCGILLICTGLTRTTNPPSRKFRTPTRRCTIAPRWSFAVRARLNRRTNKSYSRQE
jgi:DNA-binding transcriptional ArsR family regulator